LGGRRVLVCADVQRSGEEGELRNGRAAGELEKRREEKSRRHTNQAEKAT